MSEIKNQLIKKNLAARVVAALDSDPEEEFKSRGNPDALRQWYNEGAKGFINWGSEGDHTRCVEIASKYMETDQAHGFCNLRSHDATGHYSGEKEAQNQGGKQPRLSKAERKKYPKLKK